MHGYHPSYRSLTVDEWIDGSCLKTNDIENTSKRVLESSDAMTMWKGKLMCQKLGFAYALFSQKGVFCQNAIRKDFDNDKCTYQCSGDSNEKCGSYNFSNVYLTTSNLKPISEMNNLSIIFTFRSKSLAWRRECGNMENLWIKTRVVRVFQHFFF